MKTAGKLVRNGLIVGLFWLGFAIQAPAESTVVASGTFEGRSDHVVTGGVTVLKTETGFVVILESDFSLDKAPDPKLGFGKDGYQAKTQFSKLRAHKGLQAYAVPQGIDPSELDEIWVWCEKFDVPLGVATLKAP